jgi:hypothetical protein
VERILARYRPLITAVLSGFDRFVFRGSLLPLIMDGGMSTFSSTRSRARPSTAVAACVPSASATRTTSRS